MRIGVFDTIFGEAPLDEVLDAILALGVDAVELGAGGYPGRSRVPSGLSESAAARDRFRASVADRGVVVSALSCHGNPLHPDPDRAAADDRIFRETVRLADALDVRRVNLFSGCPGDGRGAAAPNWVTCTWPPDFAEVLAWQWSESAVPYWRTAAAFARDHGVRLGIEMHPGNLVYHPPSLLRLQAETDAADVLGANLDPSHLFWQGIDPLSTVRTLAGSIVHVHAKDTSIDPVNLAAKGVLDLTDRSDTPARSWTFRSVGDGHDVGWWAAFVGELASVGYDHVLSIEHEDRTRSRDDGLRRAVGTLQAAIRDAGVPVA